MGQYRNMFKTLYVFPHYKEFAVFQIPQLIYNFHLIQKLVDLIMQSLPFPTILTIMGIKQTLGKICVLAQASLHLKGSDNACHPSLRVQINCVALLRYKRSRPQKLSGVLTRLHFRSYLLYSG